MDEHDKAKTLAEAWDRMAWYVWNSRITEIQEYEDLMFMDETYIIEEAQTYRDEMPKATALIDVLHWKEGATDWEPVQMWLTGHALLQMKDCMEPRIFKQCLKDNDIPEELAREWMEYSMRSIEVLKEDVEDWHATPKRRAIKPEA